MPKVSVIIPVYNAQDYLGRCLDSVCNQTLKDIEIICVNDCSTDNSLNILNEYAEKYPNMKVIDCKVNGGESVARNIGLDNATGEYLGFVDNDDEIDLDFYEKLYAKAKEKGADIAKGELYQLNSDGTDFYGDLNQKIKENNSILYFAYHWWTGIFKTSVIKDNNIKFIEGYPLGGDILFLNQVVLASRSIVLVDDVFYHYYRRDDSGDSKILPLRKVKSAIDIFYMITENTKKLAKDKEEIDFVIGCWFEQMVNYIFRVRDLPSLKYVISKITDYFQKNVSYIKKNQKYLELLPVVRYIFEQKDEQKVLDFYLKNNSTQKVFLANLRFEHMQRKEIKK